MSRTTVLIIVLIVIAVAVGGYFGIDRYLEYKNDLRVKLAAAEQELQMVENKVKDLKKIEENLADLRQRQQDFEQMVPKDVELPQLLRDLASMLSKAGVTLTSFMPESKPVAVPTVPEMSQIGVAVAVRGNYAQVIKMFEEVGQARRLIGVGDFSVKTSLGRSLAEQGPQPLVCQFRILVFYAQRTISDRPQNNSGTVTGG